MISLSRLLSFDCSEIEELPRGDPIIECVTDVVRASTTHESNDLVDNLTRLRCGPEHDRLDPQQVVKVDLPVWMEERASVIADREHDVSLQTFNCSNPI